MPPQLKAEIVRAKIKRIFEIFIAFFKILRFIINKN
jgi:hypothetical protein